MALEKRVLRERYELMTEIGRGGFSVVWLARDINLGSYWAVKQVKNNSSVEFNSFIKEVELLSTLNYANIPRIVDRIEDDDDYFVVMDFIDGSALSKLVNLQGPQDEKSVIQWAISVCDTMIYLHSNNPESGKRPVVYRDLKPDNIMLCPSGAVKIIDFGASTFYQPDKRFSGEAIGTRGYAAPEQYKGGSNILGEYSDIYSLGATMYYLSTGFTPEMPPNGVPSVRSKNPDLSDAFEFCVAKCTADAPANRYQSFAELKQELENIDKLSGLYRKKQKNRLVAFYSCLSLSAVFFLVGLAGYNRFQTELGNRYQTAYQEAAAYTRDQDYLNAARYYAKAIQAKPEDLETHILLFNTLLPHNNGTEEARASTMVAIDEMRKGYLENKSSPMYQNPKLMYMVVRRCIEVEDIEYAKLATQYIQQIKSSDEYAAGTLNTRELQSLEVIASFTAQNTTDADYELFNETLLELEEYTNTAPLTTDEKLNNYYLLIKMLSAYPNSIPDAYSRALALGASAREELIRNSADDTLTFNNIISLYELVAIDQYNRGTIAASDAEREEAFKDSIEWFGYLEELNVDLPLSLHLKKANAYNGVFISYLTPMRRERITPAVQEYLELAISQYQDIIRQDSRYFLAYVNLAQAYYSKETLKPVEDRDFTNTVLMYHQAKEMAGTDETIPSTYIMQFSALGELLKNAGLGV